MIYVPQDATNDEIFDIIHTWVDILATRDYEAAFTAIISDFKGETWTPHFHKIAIEGYLSPGFYSEAENFRITDWRTAQGGNPENEREIIWYKPNTRGNNDSKGDYLLGLDEIGSWAQQQRRWEEEDRLAEEQSVKER